MEYKSPPLKTIQLKSLVLQLRGGRPGKEQGQLAVKDTDPDYLKILTNYPQQAEYIRNKNRLDDNITIKIYSDKEFKKLVATVPPEKIPNNLKRPESVVSNIKGELTEISALPEGVKLVSKTVEEKPKVGAQPASESGSVAAGASKPLELSKSKRLLADLTLAKLVPPLPVKEVEVYFTNRHTSVEEIYDDIERYAYNWLVYSQTRDSFDRPHIYFRRVWEKMETENPEFFKWLESVELNLKMLLHAFFTQPEEAQDEVYDEFEAKRENFSKEFSEYVRQNVQLNPHY